MSSLHVVVVGAGAFGGWTALALRRRGARVTLIDAWGPGNVRASSGGESRVIRAAYGSRSIYTMLTLRALELWRAHDPGRRLLHETGVLWLFGDDDSFGRTSAQVLREHGARLDSLALAEVRRRYPQIDFDGVTSVFWEQAAGYLLARRACEEVVDRLAHEGGEYRQAAAAMPVAVDGDLLRRLPLADGSSLEADLFVFACGPWLSGIFPGVAPITTSRQEVLYFGTAPGDGRFTVRDLPVWMDFAAGSRAGQVYGVPAAGGSGFKVADDTTGPPIDPSSGERMVSQEGVAKARAFLSRRFPALAGSPLIASEVCQYESTPDAHLLVDRHPQAPNVWLLGGGSGHGFKMGPAVGEMMARLLVDDESPDPQFRLTRIAAPPSAGCSGRWA
jgi:glycine/D-amino acid oxidase-like deaminating enzyme